MSIYISILKDVYCDWKCNLSVLITMHNMYDKAQVPNNEKYFVTRMCDVINNDNIHYEYLKKVCCHLDKKIYTVI